MLQPEESRSKQSVQRPSDLPLQSPVSCPSSSSSSFPQPVTSLYHIFLFLLVLHPSTPGGGSPTRAGITAQSSSSSRRPRFSAARPLHRAPSSSSLFLLPGMTRLAALGSVTEKSSVPSAGLSFRPRSPADCLCVCRSGPGEMKWRDLITPSPLFSLSCTLCNSHGDKGMIQAFHGRKCEKPACEKVKLLF